MTTAPTLFISHGAPTFATEPGALGNKLEQLGEALDEVQAIVALSPHWETTGLRVANTPSPKTIHDFYGFPQELFAIDYPAPGSPAVAQIVVDALRSSGLTTELDPTQGMDHGVWVPLRHLRPQADIPVVCLSLPRDATPESTWALGRALAPLRHERTLIMGTGSLTHNLGEFRNPTTTEAWPYVAEFTAWVRQQANKNDKDALCRYRELAPHAKRAHPTEEHLLPLFFALGATLASDHFEVLTTEVRYGMLSMESYAWH